MRFAALVALTLGLTPASGLSVFREDQSVVVKDNLDVPGESPLRYCEENRDDDLITITSVDLSPNPPEACVLQTLETSQTLMLTMAHSGKELIIEAVGIVYEDIQDGAYINLQVKYGLIRLVNTKADLCEQIKNVDLECPIEKGIISITKSVDLPKEIPPVSLYSSH